MQHRQPTCLLHGEPAPHLMKRAGRLKFQTRMTLTGYICISLGHNAYHIPFSIQTHTHALTHSYVYAYMLLQPTSLSYPSYEFLSIRRQLFSTIGICKIIMTNQQFTIYDRNKIQKEQLS